MKNKLLILIAVGTLAYVVHKQIKKKPTTKPNIEPTPVQEQKNTISFDNRLITQGDSSEEIKVFKNNLNYLTESEYFIDDENFDRALFEFSGEIYRSFIIDFNSTINKITGYGSTQSNIPKTATEQTIKKGDKGKDIETLQHLINSIYGGTDLEQSGAYSRETCDLVNELFAGTSALINPETGEISVNFIKTFNNILTKI